MENVILSGGRFGGYVIKGLNAVLFETIEDVATETDSVPYEVDGTKVIVDGWMYDTALSPENRAEYCGTI